MCTRKAGIFVEYFFQRVSSFSKQNAQRRVFRLSSSDQISESEGEYKEVDPYYIANVETRT